MKLISYDAVEKGMVVKIVYDEVPDNAFALDERFKKVKVGKKKVRKKRKCWIVGVVEGKGIRERYARYVTLKTISCSGSAEVLEELHQRGSLGWAVERVRGVKHSDRVIPSKVYVLNDREYLFEVV